MKSAGASVEELQEVEEVGPKVAESIRQFFCEERNRELVERLRRAELQFTQAKKARKRESSAVRHSYSPVLYRL